MIHQIDGGRASLLAILQEGQARVVELTAPAGLLPAAVKDLRLPRDSIIGTVLRGDDVIVPRGDHVIQAGDTLLVCCKDPAVRGVRDLFVRG